MTGNEIGQVVRKSPTGKKIPGVHPCISDRLSVDHSRSSNRNDRPIVIAEQPLSVIALIVAIVSMVLSSIALWPQWKHGLGVVRDLVLWAALAFVVVMVLNHSAGRRQPSPARASEIESQSADDYRALPVRGIRSDAMSFRAAQDSSP